MNLIEYSVRAAELVAQNSLAAVVVAILALLPGWGMASGVGKRLGWGFDVVAPAAFTLTIAFAGTAAAMAYFLGFGLLPAALGMLLLSVLGWIWGLRAGGPGVARPEKPLVITTIAVAVLAAGEGPYMGLTADTFYHLAAVRSLLERDMVLVTDPVYGTSTKALDPTSGTWHTLMAMWTRLTTIDPSWIWGGLNVVAAVLLVIAFWALAKRIGGSNMAATIATWAWVTFGLYVDFRPAANPELGSLAMVFAVTCAFLDLAETPFVSLAVFAALGTAAVASVHLGSAQLIATLGVALAFWLGLGLVVRGIRDRKWEWKPLAALAVSGAAGLAAAVPMLLPRVSVLSGGSGTPGSGLVDVMNPDIPGRISHLPMGMDVAGAGALTGEGPLLAAIAAGLAAYMLFWAFYRKGDMRLLGGAAVAALPLLTIYNPAFVTPVEQMSHYVLDRIGALLGFTAFLTIAWALGTNTPLQVRRILRWIGYAGVAGAVVGAGIWTATTLVRVPGVERRGARYPVYITRLQDMRYVWDGALQELAKAEAKKGSPPVVAGDGETVYYLIGLEPVVAMNGLRSHSTYAVEQKTGVRRREDAATLMAANTSSEVRREYLDRWDVDYVAFWLEREPQKRAWQEMRYQKGLFKEIVVNKTFALLAVKR